MADRAATAEGSSGGQLERTSQPDASQQEARAAGSAVLMTATRRRLYRIFSSSVWGGGPWQEGWPGSQGRVRALDQGSGAQCPTHRLSQFGSSLASNMILAISTPSSH